MMTKLSLNKLRSFFWPVKKSELKKFVPIFLMSFFFNYIYLILKDVRESLVVTAQGSGAEAIPFIKMWVILPLGLVFMFVYSRLSKKLNRSLLFYSTIAFFIGFYLLFAILLYPLREVLHPNLLADKLELILPLGFKGFVAIFRNWTFTLFYAMAELWGSVGISMIFWGFSNDIVSLSESKRFYSLLGLGTCFSMICSGPTLIYFSNITKSLYSNNSWGLSICYLMTIVFLFGLFIMAVYWWMKNHLLNDKKFYKTKEMIQIKSNKSNISFKESLKHIKKSRYLQLLAMIVIAYSISVTFIEVVWKNQLKIQFPNPNDYSTFKGYFSIFTSISSFIMLFLGGGIIRKFGWKKAALATPLVLLVFGASFFGFILFSDHFSYINRYFQIAPLMLALILGTGQYLVGKSFKYSLFDPTKEMAYIPLDQDSKAKGKAAIDVLLTKFSKAGGAFILQALLVFFGSIAAIMPFIAILLLGIIVFWMISVILLDKHFILASKKKEVLKKVPKLLYPKAAEKIKQK